MLKLKGSGQSRTALECRASAKSTVSRGGALPIPISRIFGMSAKEGLSRQDPALIRLGFARV